ncbi:hypothetical protein WICPIJ_008211 [Wickerhamomyces pijperi]|uniref:Uncharacterized protein n=1 Tax=Wickerhamomyces pijperi TaxID=599730 RepID=A0A9P8PYC4_WICPI|nr:hypothetical protein WICPIJ_008211 [Wickerhamomyces pijperi]
MKSLAKSIQPIKSKPQMKGLDVIEFIPATTGPMKYGPNLFSYKVEETRLANVSGSMDLSSLSLNKFVLYLKTSFNVMASQIFITLLTYNRKNDLDMALLNIGISGHAHFSGSFLRSISGSRTIAQRTRSYTSFSTLTVRNPNSFTIPSSKLQLHSSTVSNQVLPPYNSVRHPGILFTRSYSNSNRPPRFNGGVPRTPIGLIWQLLPPPVKAFIAITGVSSVLIFTALPLLFIMLPPLFIGGFIFARLFFRRSKRNFLRHQEELDTSSLKFEGNLLDFDLLRSFVSKRTLEALEINEKNILDELHLIDGANQHHTFGSRFSLTDVESIDQNYDFSSLNSNSLNHINGTVTTVTFGLIDKDSRSFNKRPATVIVSLRTQDVRSLLDLNSGSTCVIEVKPTMNFSKSIIINTPSGNFDSDTVFEVKRSRTRNRKY